MGKENKKIFLCESAGQQFKFRRNFRITFSPIRTQNFMIIPNVTFLLSSFENPVEIFKRQFSFFEFEGLYAVSFIPTINF